MGTLPLHQPRRAAGRPEHEIAELWQARGSDVQRGLLGGRYEFRKRLGVGGMSQVFLAWDLRLQREVAVKMLRTEFVKNPYEVSRFLIEGQLLARIESDHIVQIFDTISDDSHCYLVLERVTGENLEQIVARRGALPVFDALQATRDVLLALVDLHRQGVIHRDLKPANILVGDTHAKLLDLGVACDEGSPGFTQPHQTVGTPGYMSPEQRATGYVDARSDLYQLGLVMLHALTAVDLPAARHNFTDALAKAPPELRPIFDKVLAEDPDDRYQSAGSMLADVQVWCNGARTVEIAVVDAAAIAAHMAKQASEPVMVHAPTTGKRRVPVLSAPSAGMSMIIPPANNARIARFAAIGAAVAAVAVAMVAVMRSPSDAQAETKQAPVAVVVPHAAPAVKVEAKASAPAPVTEAKLVVPAAAPVPAVVSLPPKREVIARVQASVEQRPVTRPSLVARDGNLGFAPTTSRDVGRQFANATTGGPADAPAPEIAAKVAVEAPAAPVAPPATVPHTGTPDGGAAVIALARKNESIGANEVAIAGYRRYLRENPDGAEVDWIRAHLTSMESGRPRK